MAEDFDTRHCKCHYPKCAIPPGYFYYGIPVCDYHYTLHCKGKIDLKEVLNIREEKKAEETTA